YGVHRWRHSSANYQAKDWRAWPEFPALRSHDRFPVALIRAVLPGRSPVLALRPEAGSRGRYGHDRGRAENHREPHSQGRRRRGDVCQSHCRDEPRDDGSDGEAIQQKHGASRMGRVIDQTITDNYAIYNGDCVDVMKGIPDGAVHLSVYSPPFGGLYHYSSDERDLSNCRDYDQFFEHYR